jgi:uncharacterized membrane protein required for colicin V production
MDYFISFLKQFNWVDFCVFILFVRIFYISINTGLTTEICKTLGTITAAYLSLHYYTPLSNFINERAAMQNTTIAFAEAATFLTLALLGYSIFWGIRLVIKKFMTVEIDNKVSKWGGAGLGFLRALLLSSLILYGLYISSIEYFQKSVATSNSGMSIIYFAPSAYRGIWNGFVSKFVSNGQFNSVVFDIKKPEENVKDKKNKK